MQTITFCRSSVQGSPSKESRALNSRWVYMGHAEPQSDLQAFRCQILGSLDSRKTYTLTARPAAEPPRHRHLRGCVEASSIYLRFRLSCPIRVILLDRMMPMQETGLGGGGGGGGGGGAGGGSGGR